MRKVVVERRWAMQAFADPTQAIRADMASSDLRAKEDSKALKGHFVRCVGASLERLEFHLDDGRVLSVWSEHDDVAWSILPGSDAPFVRSVEQQCWPIEIQVETSSWRFDAYEFLAPYLKYPLLWLYKGNGYLNIEFIDGGAIVCYGLWNESDNAPFLGVACLG